MRQKSETNDDKLWRFWIDRGGTFTDLVAVTPDQQLKTYKLLSHNPDRYKDAAIQGIRELLEVAPTGSLPTERIAEVRMGTTVATNALLERRGDPTALVITAGFKDALRIGYQNRPDLFAKHIELPSLLYQTVIEVEERIGASGEVLQALNEQRLKAQLIELKESGIDSVAIVFMHAYRYPQHEKIAAKLAAETGFGQISVSHEISPLMKLVSRGDTSVVDAYLTPLLRRYVEQVAEALGDTCLQFMQSNGGLVDAQFFQGKDSILSGPAGGIVGAAEVCIAAGIERMIAFDMGGTSTDVSHFAGEYERAFDTKVAGVRMRVPIMHIHTVAAGGGSILQFDGMRFRVGPESAGAVPGPAAYRRGGPLTVTDCQVMLGRLRPEYFPKVFGPEGNQALDVGAVENAFATLSNKVSKTTGCARDMATDAAGFLQIAIENMANAIKEISVQRGYDVTQYTLCSFGGAGGQHACGVADALGMTRVYLHPFAGVLSAYGMGLASVRALREQALELPLSDNNWAELTKVYAEVESNARRELLVQQIAERDITITAKVHVRPKNSDSILEIPFADAETLRTAFAQAYFQRYGFKVDTNSLVIEAIAVEAVANSGAKMLGRNSASFEEQLPDEPLGLHSVFFAGEFVETPFYQRAALAPQTIINGPAVLVEETGTVVLEPGWQARVDNELGLHLERTVVLTRQKKHGTDADPILLEVFNNLFMSIAEQMGAALQNTAFSVNIKERLDFSCAIFDSDGELIANAPHMPVHLGSMGESVRHILRARENSMRSGDVFVLNDPYHGGTHLPDVTVVTPIFVAGSEMPLFYVASRGHHADIGGITPGSMPSDSKTIMEEGVLINNFQLVKAGEFQEQAMRDLLTSGTYPARNPDQNIADLKAQVAANERGLQELHKMIEVFSLPVVQAYMGHVKDNAEECVRRAIEKLSNGSFNYQMDNGAEVAVQIVVDKNCRSVTVDFTGSSAALANNFNAPSAVCRAAVLYVFRTLVEDDIPLNDGCLKPIEIKLPSNSMLNPSSPAAVVAGNVETSQCITDCLYGALGVMAAAQGTMNNFTFGNERYQYYETICGGSGAGPGFHGTDAVHTHMTNSRLTDPEVLEFRFPVQLMDFKVRDGSGGAGEFHGGNGVHRDIKFLQAMEVSILSDRRIIPPYGLEGGDNALPGSNRCVRANGTEEELASTAYLEVREGDRIVIETPGGGGWGTPNSD